MKSQTLFIIVSVVRISYGIRVASAIQLDSASENIDLPETPMPKCIETADYYDRPFNLLSAGEGGHVLTISEDGQVQAGEEGGHKLVARLTRTPDNNVDDDQKKPYTCLGNLGGQDKYGNWNMDGYFSTRPDPARTGGGYAFRFSTGPPCDKLFMPPLFEFVCLPDGRLILAATEAKGGNMYFMGCKHSKGLNVAFNVKSDADFNSRCYNYFPYLYVEFKQDLPNKTNAA